MKPIIKWPGGKTSEIDMIKKFTPDFKGRYVEPFLGGGAIFFKFENNKSIVNDFNCELISFYKLIKSENFQSFSEKVSAFSHLRMQLFEEDKLNDISFNNAYEKYTDYFYHNDFNARLLKEINAKIKMKNKIEKNNGKEITRENEKDLIRTAICATLYYCIRNDYNSITEINEKKIFSWFIMRELSYSGMFRFSKNGKFNVPYGGMSYNRKNIELKLKQMELLKDSYFFNNTEFNNMDFEMFFKKYQFFNENDFIFLDPPYDTEFSQYNKETDFDKEDQERLKNTLLKTKAKIMVVIKDTPFIRDLYQNEFIIREFDKNYSVNMKNRNKQEVKHLIITNYE